MQIRRIFTFELICIRVSKKGTLFVLAIT